MMRWITEADCIRCGLRSSVTTKASQGPEIAIRVARLPWLFPFWAAYHCVTGKFLDPGKSLMPMNGIPSR